MTRQYTNKLYELVDSGVLSWEDIGKACLAYMSESDVEDMCSDYEWLEEDAYVSDVEVLKQMKELVDDASSRSTTTTFENIWYDFWEYRKQLSSKFDIYYYDPDEGYADDILACWNALLEQCDELGIELDD